MTVRVPSAGAAGAAGPPLSTSSLVMRPPGPVPVTAARPTPSTAATRAATGVTFLPSDAAGAAAAGAGASPDSISHSSWPTSTVSPSPAWIFTTVPVAGEGTSASTLSVEISTSTSSRSTGSPSFLCHSRTVPSVTDSPMAGMATCTVVFTAIESLTLARRPCPLLAHELDRADERADPADDDDGDGQADGDDRRAGRVDA